MKQAIRQKEKVITHVEMEANGYSYLVTIRMMQEERGQYTADWFCRETRETGALGYYLDNCYAVEAQVEKQIWRRHQPKVQEQIVFAN